MELYKILFIIGAVLVIVGLVPAVVDSIKTIKDILHDFKDDKSFIFEVLMLTTAIICFFIGIIILFITKVI